MNVEFFMVRKTSVPWVHKKRSFGQLLQKADNLRQNLLTCQIR